LRAAMAQSNASRLSVFFSRLLALRPMIAMTAAPTP